MTSHMNGRIASLATILDYIYIYIISICVYMCMLLIYDIVYLYIYICCWADNFNFVKVMHPVFNKTYHVATGDSQPVNVSISE